MRQADACAHQTLMHWHCIACAELMVAESRWSRRQPASHSCHGAMPGTRGPIGRPSCSCGASQAAYCGSASSKSRCFQACCFRTASAGAEPNEASVYAVRKGATSGPSASRRQPYRPPGLYNGARLPVAACLFCCSPSAKHCTACPCQRLNSVSVNLLNNATGSTGSGSPLAQLGLECST